MPRVSLRILRRQRHKRTKSMPALRRPLRKNVTKLQPTTQPIVAPKIQKPIVAPTILEPNVAPTISEPTVAKKLNSKQHGRKPSEVQKSFISKFLNENDLDPHFHDSSDEEEIIIDRRKSVVLSSSLLSKLTSVPHPIDQIMS